MPEVGSACESENLLGTSSSSNPDANIQQNQNEEDVWVRREDKEADSKSNKSAGSTVTEQSNGDDMGNGDSTNDSDSEVFLIFHCNPATLRTFAQKISTP